MEAEIRDLNTNLESMVVERTAELARANESLRRLARRDVLTELPNRLAANERLHSEFVGMKRSDTAYAVLMIDIDHFKRVNDSHGHAVGDQVLQRIARVAEKIRQAVEASPDPTAGPLTLSVGVAMAHDEQASENEAVLDADRALYVAKDQGRNQVQQAPESLAWSQADEAIAENLVHLVWRDVYRSGNAVIDAQHRALMAQAGELSKHYGAGTLTLGELFAFLARAVVAHHMLVADREFFAHLASKR
jgi:GGDEF domain-containing protein